MKKQNRAYSSSTSPRQHDAWIKYPGWFLVIYLFIGQGIPALDYELGITMGTQDSADVVTPVGTAFWYGFCLADLILYIPLLAAGMYLRDRQSGQVLLAAALGITAYWPIVCLTAAISARGMEGWQLDDTPFLVVLPVIVAWAMWALVWCIYYTGDNGLKEVHPTKNV